MGHDFRLEPQLSMTSDASPNEWARLEALLDKVLDAEPEQRATLISQLSAGDAARRADLEKLVAECERSHRLLDRSALERFAGLVHNEVPSVPGIVADRYRILRELGRGGMAVVYLATDLKHGREVALKVVRPALAAALGASRFLREIEIAAKLHHPHIVSLYDSGEADGVVYYVMPYERGFSLREKLQRDGELPIPEAVRILRDVADAMAYAHSQGVVHRDIKPENVLLADRHALVTDFGIAKAVSAATDRQTLTTAGVALGTPAYMAPEQIAADPRTDHRADIYALGAMAYELLSGQPPFVRPTTQGVLGAHMTEPAAPLIQHRASVPAPLAALVMKCLEKKPADRWQSADELLRALEIGYATSVTPAAIVPRRGLWRSKVIIIASGLAVIALGIAAWQFNRDRSGLDPNRVAVMRFENLTGADSLESFGAIVSDMITNGLSRTEVVSVVPAASVAASSIRGGKRVPVDPSTLARDTKAGLVVTGSYFLRADSLGIQAQIVDVRRGQPLAPVELVTVPIAAQPQGILAVQERVMVALSGRTDLRLAQYGAHSVLPMSLAAYREYAAGVEGVWFNDLSQALEHFYRAIRLDSASSIAILHTALAEWNLNFDLPKVDSLLHVVERHRTELAPFDLAYLDWLRAYLDGDLESGLRVTRRWADDIGGFPWPAVQANHRLNRLEEAHSRAMAVLETPVYRRSNTTWSYLAGVLHAQGKHERELREVRIGIEEFERTGSVPMNLHAAEIRALAALGRAEELTSRLTAMRAVDPSNSSFYVAARELWWHGYAKLAAEIGRVAVQWYREALQRSPSRAARIRLAQSLFELEQWDEARRLFMELDADFTQNAVTTDNWRGYDVLPVGYLGIDAARRGDTTVAEAMIQRLESFSRPYLLGANIGWQARIAARLGQCDRTVSFLQEALRKGDSPHTGDRETSEFAKLQSCPAFQQWMEPKG
jgi:TolB-like protein